MIATIGSILVWGLIVAGVLFGVFCAVIGFAFLRNFKL